MPTEMPSRAARNPIGTLARALLCALPFVMNAAAAQAQIGIVGPSAPSPAYILLGQGRAGASNCVTAAPAPYERNVRRGQESNPGGATAIDARTGLACPPR